jgi:hypothetical protein
LPHVHMAHTTNVWCTTKAKAQKCILSEWLTMAQLLHIWDMGYSGCSRQSCKLPSPMWDRQSPPRAHTRIRLSHRLPCDHSSLHLYHLPRFARFPAYTINITNQAALHCWRQKNCKRVDRAGVHRCSITDTSITTKHAAAWWCQHHQAKSQHHYCAACCTVASTTTMHVPLAWARSTPCACSPSGQADIWQSCQSVFSISCW